MGRNTRCMAVNPCGVLSIASSLSKTTSPAVAAWIPMLMLRANTNGFTPICQSMGSVARKKKPGRAVEIVDNDHRGGLPAARIARTQAPRFASVLLGMMIDRGFITLQADSCPREAHLARARVASVNRRVFQLGAIGCHQVASGTSRCHELVVLADLHRAEPIALPPVAAVDERCTQRVIRRSSVFPPALSIREPDRVIAGDALARLLQARELVDEPARLRMVVVIPVRD